MSKLPERASLEYLKKLAKDRLQELRRTDPRAKLAAALLAVAQDHGFSSWRALKAELDQRQQREVARFFAACAGGDVDVLRSFLTNDPAMARASNPAAPHPGWTGLHAAAKSGHLQAVRLLLEHGADPNAREAGDNTYPLHWAAALGHLDVVRCFLIPEATFTAWAMCTSSTSSDGQLLLTRRATIPPGWLKGDGSC